MTVAVAKQTGCVNCKGEKKVKCQCNGTMERKATCLSCNGTGMIDVSNCMECAGKGIEECIDCNGSGREVSGKACLSCRGKGVVHCSRCEGNGQINNRVCCNNCQAQGFYIQECDCDNGYKTCELCQGKGLLPTEVREPEQEHQIQENVKPQQVDLQRNHRQLPQRKKPMKQVIFGFAVIIIVMAIRYYPQLMNKFNKDDSKTAIHSLLNVSKPTDSDQAVNAAQTLLDKNLTSPSTASLVSSKIVAKEPPMYLVHLVVDSQNAFGAMVRTSALISVELKGDGNEFKYNPLTSIQESSNPPLDLEITLAKQLNKWPSTLFTTEPSPTAALAQPDSSSISNDSSSNQTFNAPDKSTSIIRSTSGDSLTAAQWLPPDNPDVRLPITIGKVKGDLVIGLDHPNGTKFIIDIPSNSVKRPLPLTSPDGDTAFGEGGWLNEGYKIQATLHDFDRDGIDEIVIAAGNTVNESSIWVFSYTEVNDAHKEDQYKQVLCVTGQAAIVLDGDKLITPIGSHDSWTYQYVNKKFIKS